MLTFIEIVGVGKARFLCSCGDETVAYTYNVKSGHTTSCGCVRREATRLRAMTHGHKRDCQRTRVYVAWINMRQRCDNANCPDYPNYGGRGIRYDEAWESFENFLADMGEPGPSETIDRIDNALGYSKANCRWTTRAVQSLNKRSCVRYEHGGKSQTLAEWARETGIGRVTMLKRIQRGVPLDLALTVRGFLKMPPGGASHMLARIA